MKLKVFDKIYHRTIGIVFASFGLMILLFLFLTFLLARTSLFGNEVISENTGLIVVACVLSLLIVAQILTVYWVKRIIKPVESFSGVINNIAHGNFDVKIDTSKYKSEMKILAEDMNKMITELKSIEIMRSDFVSNVSHEFKAPLSAIQGYVTLLSNQNLTEEQRTEYFTKLSESTRQITGLVDNVLRLSKLESQNIVSENKVFSLDEQLRRAVLMFEDKWVSKNIELDLDLPECDFCGNEELLYQMWTNLIGNAVKFTGENGKIYIGIDSSEKGFVCVTVQDNGIGMSEEVRLHVFEKFYQGDTSHKSEGNGLGLALVKSVAELTGATVDVESEQGKGSKFTVRLPLNE